MNNTKHLALGGLLIALVTIGTVSTRFLITPSTGGYLHLGDSIIYLAAILFGWKFGLLAGGIGSAIADILLGAPIYAIPSLIVKGIEGAIVGKIANRSLKEKSLRYKDGIAVLIGGAWMILGYYLTDLILYGHKAAYPWIPLNFVQAGAGAIIGFILIFAVLRTSILDIINNK